MGAAFSGGFSGKYRLLDKDPYWVNFPQFAHHDASKATVACTISSRDRLLTVGGAQHWFSLCPTGPGRIDQSGDWSFVVECVSGSEGWALDPAASSGAEVLIFEPRPDDPPSFFREARRRWDRTGRRRTLRRSDVLNGPPCSSALHTASAGKGS